MAELIGKEAYIEFAGQSLVAKFRKFDPGVAFDTTETSAGGSSYRKYRPTLGKCEPKATFILSDDATGLAVRNILKVGTTGSLIWGPQGNAAGKPKYGITAQVVSSNRSLEYDKEIEIEVEWINTADTMLFDFDTNAAHVF